MADFEIYRGPEAELAKIECHNGFVYFTQDQGNLYFDIADGGDPNVNRIRLNAYFAEELRKIQEDGTIKRISFDDIALKEAVNKEIEKVTTVAKTLTIAPSDWTAEEDKFSYTWASLTWLQCGKGGDVPPIITNTSNLEEYSNIESAIATPGVSIKFLISKKPINNIDLVIIDNR